MNPPDLDDIFDAIARRAMTYTLPTCYDSLEEFENIRQQFVDDLLETTTQLMDLDEQNVLLFRNIFQYLSYAIPCPDYKHSASESNLADQDDFYLYVRSYLGDYFCAQEEPDTVEYDTATNFGLQRRVRSPVAEAFCHAMTHEFDQLTKPIISPEREEPLWADYSFLLPRANSWYQVHVPNIEIEKEMNEDYFGQKLYEQNTEARKFRNTQVRERIRKQLNGHPISNEPLEEYVRVPDLPKYERFIQERERRDMKWAPTIQEDCEKQFRESGAQLTTREKEYIERCAKMKFNQLHIREVSQRNPKELRGVKRWLRDRSNIGRSGGNASPRERKLRFSDVRAENSL